MTLEGKEKWIPNHFLPKNAHVYKYSYTDTIIISPKKFSLPFTITNQACYLLVHKWLETKIQIGLKSAFLPGTKCLQEGVSGEKTKQEIMSGLESPHCNTVACRKPQSPKPGPPGTHISELGQINQLSCALASLTCQKGKTTPAFPKYFKCEDHVTRAMKNL